jgi:hypothetical protein
VSLGLLTAVDDVFRLFSPSLRPNAHAVYCRILTDLPLIY